MNFLRWIFLSALISISLAASAGDCKLDKTEATFDLKSIEKKGILLSDLFKNQKGSKVRIKHSDAMRFDANYMPNPPSKKPVDLPIGEINKQVQRAHDVLEKVKSSQAFTTALNGKNIELPIGIKRTIGNKEIIICLDSIVFTPSNGYGVLYVIIEDTKNNKKLAFWGKDIKFTKDGGFTGDARLELLQTYDLQVGQNSTVSFLVDKTHENYAVFDCNGFKHLHVDSRIFFSKEMFLLEKPDGTLDQVNRVTTDFTADFESFDDWLVQINNVPKFQVVGLEGMSFQIGGMALDYSSLENPKNMTFPGNYTSPDFVPGKANIWEGFLINNLTVTLPEEFKLKSKTSERISLSIPSAVIDRMGFTGKAEVNNLIPLTEGSMSDWNYSLDYISVDIVKNTPVAASFKGDIILPISKSTEFLGYNANILPGHNYNITVKTYSTMNFPMWGAGNVQINPDSWIKIALVNKKFQPEASLNGKFDLTCSVNGKAGDNNTTDKNSNLSLAQISFTKLRIRTIAPIISIDPNGGAVSFGSPLLEQKMAKLPVSIKDVGMQSRNNGNQMGIRFTVLVNLVGEKDSGGGFSGSADVTVWAQQNTTDIKWSYYKTELNKIVLDNVKIALITLSGYVEFYRDDQTYGSGFSGGIKFNIELTAGKNIGLDAVCIFGKKDVPNNPNDIYRYWAVDVLASVPAIPLFPGIMSLNAFGGGGSYKMHIDNNVQNAKFVSNSGVSYVPDYNKGLGLKALIGIQGSTREAYEGQIIFEIEFNANGGLSMIAFSGYVQIANLGKFDQLQKLKSSIGGFVDKVKAAGGGTAHAMGAASSSQVYGEIQKMGDGGALLAQWRMVLDRNNNSFTANIDMFVDVKDIIKGRNAYSHAGRIDILFCPKEWHIFVGRPDYALGLNVVSFVDINGYFMMGQNMPTPLPMPNGKRANFPNVPVNGMGMGARLHMGSEGSGTFWYKVGIDAGFDFLMWNVVNQYCNGKQKGVKGWYGAGQAFLYGYAGAGFKKCVDVPYPCNFGWGCCFKIFRKRICPCPTFDWCHSNVCVDISANLTVDVSAQIEAANPTYVEATVSILGVGIGVKAGKRC